MGRFIEFEGKSVDDAIAKAMAELKKGKDDINYDIISNGSSGIFGLVGTKKAKIKVTVSEDNDLDKQAEDSGIDGVKSLVDEAFNTGAKINTHANPPDNKTDNTADETIEIDQDIITLGTEALTKIVDFITTDATVTVEQKQAGIMFNVNGGNSAILIGKRGQNLEAIQYLVDKIINKKSKKRVRVLIDVEGYLETRKDNLEKLAARMAEKARTKGKPTTIGQMNAHDRRIVHIALKNDKSVRTQSMGDGYYRKLVIFPKKNKNRRKARSGKETV